MRPPLPPSIINGNANLLHKNVPVALISNVLRHASSAICRTEPGPMAASALLIKISSRIQSIGSIL